MDQNIAVISDVHGNRWALEAVLDDLERRRVRQVVNLGDTLHGPLDPSGTARLLRGLDLLSIRGNQDRDVVEPGDLSGWSPTLRYVRSALNQDDLDWLAAHVPFAELFEGRVLLCHGTPENDNEYLVERVDECGHVEIKGSEELGAELGSVSAELILCGHSHVPRTVAFARDRLVVNPGSVGLPAYDHDHPRAHVMQVGSPHARYAVLTRTDRGWNVEHFAIAYDWARASEAAARNGRPDWAEWLRTGRA